jgi:transcription-repair coupling factor (superfamily II helicase)
MTLTGLLPVLVEDPAVTALVDLADPSATDTGAVDVVCSEGLRPPLLAALAARRPLLVVTATAREADDTVAGLASFLPEGSVVGFPAWETLPHERLSPRSDTVAERLQVLRRLAHPARTPPAPCASSSRRSAR